MEQFSSEDGIVFRGFEKESCDVLVIGKDAPKEETVSLLNGVEISSSNDN